MASKTQTPAEPDPRDVLIAAIAAFVAPTVGAERAAAVAGQFCAHLDGAVRRNQEFGTLSPLDLAPFIGLEAYVRARQAASEAGQ